MLALCKPPKWVAEPSPTNQLTYWNIYYLSPVSRHTLIICFHQSGRLCAVTWHFEFLGEIRFRLDLIHDMDMYLPVAVCITLSIALRIPALVYKPIKKVWVRELTEASFNTNDRDVHVYDFIVCIVSVHAVLLGLSLMFSWKKQKQRKTTTKKQQVQS